MMKSQAQQDAAPVADVPSARLADLAAPTAPESPALEGIRSLSDLADKRQNLQQLLANLHATRGDWPELVSQKIEKDYSQRLLALESEIAALERETPGWAVSLDTIEAELSDTLEKLILEQKESECRHALGELDQDELNHRLEPVIRDISAIRTRQEILFASRRRCLEVLDASERTRFLVGTAEMAAASEDALAPLPKESSTIPPPAPGRPTPWQMPSDSNWDLERPTPARNERNTNVQVTPPNPPGSRESVLDSLAGEISPLTVQLETANVFERTEAHKHPTLVSDEPIDGQTRFVVLPLTTIGRDPTNLYPIVDPTVSRKHATLSLTPQGYLLVDLDSGNGTRVNGSVVHEALLRNGDRVEFGIVAFRFETLS